MKSADKKTLWRLARPGKKTAAVLIALAAALPVLIILSGFAGVSGEWLSAVLGVGVGYPTSVCRIILLLDAMLLLHFSVDPAAALFTMAKNISVLESAGCLKEAAAELHAVSASESCVWVTEHYVFGQYAGIACATDEIIWCYTRRQSFFLMPMKEVLLICLRDGRQLLLAEDRAGKYGTTAIGSVMEQIFARKPDMRFGCTNANRSAYRTAVKEWRGSHR